MQKQKKPSPSLKPKRAARKPSKPRGLLGDTASRTWEREWKGMPEFMQPDLNPFKTVRVHFRCKEDLIAFGELLGQSVGMMTKFVWYPPSKTFKYGQMHYAEKRKAKP